ncbi:MAG: PleD family two-component system response regulator [Campylobacterales bacterium]
MIKVLTVDDNKDNRLTLRLLLDEYDGISIFEADNGKKGVESVKIASPDIIFMDIMMPIMDGIEAVKQIREFDTTSIIVAVSVLGDDEHKNEMLKAGAEDYITKPINEELFKARMKNYISIVEFRRTKARMNGAVNLFSKEVYHKKTAFIIKDEAGLAEFWDSQMPLSENDNLCDTVRAIYNTGLHLLRTNREFQIIAEENDDTSFFSLVGLRNFAAQDVRDTFAKENPLASLVIKSDEISISLPKQLTLSQIVEKEKISLDESDKQILRMTHTEKISAKAFAAELEPDIMDKLERLEANEETLDALVYEFETKTEMDILAKIAEEIGVYATEIDALYEFKNLSYALLSLATFLKNIDNNAEDRKKQKLAIIIRSIFDDLTNWRKTVFVTQSTEDIHYLDSSLLSSCLQVELIFKDATLEESEDDLELF